MFVRTNTIKKKKSPAAKIIMIRNDLKIVRNEKGNPQSHNAETESEDDKIFWALKVKAKLLL